jgi:cystathionine gamma-synthase
VSQPLSPDDRFGTRAVHAGLDPDPTYRSVIPPIHQTSTFAQRRPGEFVGDYDYARSANPTRMALERALGELEGGRGVTFASGLAAEHALITVVCRPGSHVVLPADLYGGTYRLVDKVLARWGLTYELVDQTDLAALERAVRDDTRLVWVESPTNPRLDVVDIEAVIARRRNALVAVDNTFATPANQRPLDLGADFVVHSTTKYLGGHSDIVGGVVVTGGDHWHEQLRFVQNAVGAVPGPFDCFLVHRGAADTAPANGCARAERGGGRRPGAVRRRGLRRPLARVQRDGQLPPPARGSGRGRDPPVHARRVARRSRVADRAASGDDTPVG